MRIIAGFVAAALLATAVAAPADARRRHHRDHDDVDTGDVIAGALVVGGIAALLSAGSTENKRRKQDAAVDACAGEAERREGGLVGEITGVSKRNGYYTVRGELDAREPLAFTCIVRNGSIYSFRTAPY